LRTYRTHERGSDALDAPGTRDVTTDVCLETLRRSAARAGLSDVAETTQAAWLEGLGIGEMVAEGEAIWRERAHLGDLAALAGRSRGTEAVALTDATGLGAHTVLVLAKGVRDRSG
jgi:SAM-dependent MidA family methyltransferase